MLITKQYLEESKYKNIDYSDEAAREYKKKRYISNNYYWYYVGKDGDYTEMPEHVFVWNKHHPHARLNPSDGNLIHHKDGNKKNNAPSNLERKKKIDHDRDHLTKRRKELPTKFSKKTASKGGKNAHKLHPELKDNLNKKKVVKEDLMVFVNINSILFAKAILFYIIGIISSYRDLSYFRTDKEVSDKLNKLANDGMDYKVKFWNHSMINAFAYTMVKGSNIVYTKGIKEYLTEDELYAVLLHEAGHINQRKQYINFKTFCANFIPSLICSNVITAILSTGLMINPSVLIIMVMVSMSGLIPKRLSRYFEYDADSYVIKYGYEKHMISVLKKFENLNEPKTFLGKLLGPISELFSTHPSDAHRIEALLKKAELYKILMAGKLRNAIKYSFDYLNVEINDKIMNIASIMFNKFKK